jgi:hypothetical protein
MIGESPAVSAIRAPRQGEQSQSERVSDQQRVRGERERARGERGENRGRDDDDQIARIGDPEDRMAIQE